MHFGVGPGAGGYVWVGWLGLLGPQNIRPPPPPALGVTKQLLDPTAWAALKASTLKHHVGCTPFMPHAPLFLSP